MDAINYNGPVNPDPADGESTISIYGYTPDNALAAIALLTYGLVFINHLGFFARFRGTRTFYLLLMLGNAFEIVGYSCRLQSHFNSFIVVFFIVQYFFIVCAPLFLQAALYIAFAKALRRLDHYGSTLLGFSPKLLTKILIVADVVTTIIQVAGAALIGVAESARFSNSTSRLSSESANNILLAGLAIQSLTFLGFLILVGFCIIRSERTFTAAHLPKTFSVLIFLSALLLLLRTLFRLAETAQGVFGTASSSETLFGCLEYLPVILSNALWGALSLEEILPVDVDDEPRASPSVNTQQEKSFQLGRTSTMNSVSPRNESPVEHVDIDDDSRPLDLEAQSPVGSMDKSESTTTATDVNRPEPERMGSAASSMLRTGMYEQDPLELARTASGDSKMSRRKLKN